MLFSRGYGAGGGRCVGEGTMASIYIIICTRNTKFLTFSFGYLTLPSLFGSLLVTTPTPSFYTPSALHPTPLYIGNTPRQGYLNILFAYPIIFLTPNPLISILRLLYTAWTGTSYLRNYIYARCKSGTYQGSPDSVRHYG